MFLRGRFRLAFRLNRDVNFDVGLASMFGAGLRHRFGRWL